MSLIKELASFWNFYQKTPASQRSVVFYAEDRSQWTYYEGLVQYLLNEKNIHICYVTSEKDDPIFEKSHDNLHVFYIDSLLWLFTITLNSKVLVMTMPEIEVYHIKRSLRGSHHVYLYHNIGCAVTTLKHGALFHYDTILLSGPHHKDEIESEEKKYELTKKKLVSFGYYRLEKVYQDYKNYKQNQKVETKEGMTILFGPTWGEDSLLNLHGIKVIELLLETNYRVIFRPHTMSKNHDADLIATINNTFKDNPNYSYDGDGSNVNSLYESDILVCDWSGLIYEYALGTERPTLLVNTPQKILNPKWTELGITPMDNTLRPLLGATVETDELDEIPKKINHLMDNLTVYREQLQKLRDQYVYHFGDSSAQGGEYISQLIDESGASINK